MVHRVEYFKSEILSLLSSGLPGSYCIYRMNKNSLSSMGEYKEISKEHEQLGNLTQFSLHQYTAALWTHLQVLSNELVCSVQSKISAVSLCIFTTFQIFSLWLWSKVIFPITLLLWQTSALHAVQCLSIHWSFSILFLAKTDGILQRNNTLSPRLTAKTSTIVKKLHQTCIIQEYNTIRL